MTGELSIITSGKKHEAVNDLADALWEVFREEKIEIGIAMNALILCLSHAIVEYTFDPTQAAKDAGETLMRNVALQVCGEVLQ